MSSLVYDCLTGAAAVWFGIGVFLVSLAVLDILTWLITGLLAAFSPCFKRAVQVRSALAAIQVHYQRR